MTTNAKFSGRFLGQSLLCLFAACSLSQCVTLEFNKDKYSAEIAAGKGSDSAAIDKPAKEDKPAKGDTLVKEDKPVVVEEPVVVAPLSLTLVSGNLGTFEAGPGTGVRWMLQEHDYTLAWSLENPNDVAVTWVCQIESVGLNGSDPNFLDAGTNCASVSGFTENVAAKTSYSATVHPAASSRGIFKIHLMATNRAGEMGDEESFYIGVRENWVSANSVAILDASYARTMAGDSGEELVVPAASGCYDLSWLDLSGNSNSGDLINYSACSATRGWAGSGTSSAPYALAMDGTGNGHVEIPDRDQFEFVGAAFTMEMFFRMESSVHQSFFHKWDWDGGGPKGYTMQTLDGMLTPKFVLPGGGGSTTLTGTGNITLSTWHHLVMAFNDATNASSIFLDSANPATATSAAPLRANGRNMFIGSRSDVVGVSAPGSLNGQIARAAIYNRVLTHEEVRQNCNAMKARFSSLVCN